MSSRAEVCLPRRDEGACPGRPVTEEQQRQTPLPHDCPEDDDENSQSSSLRVGQVSQRISSLLAPRCQAVLIVTHTKIFVL